MLHHFPLRKANGAVPLAPPLIKSCPWRTHRPNLWTGPKSLPTLLTDQGHQHQACSILPLPSHKRVPPMPTTAAPQEGYRQRMCLPLLHRWRTLLLSAGKERRSQSANLFPPAVPPPTPPISLDPMPLARPHLITAGAANAAQSTKLRWHPRPCQRDYCCIPPGSQPRQHPQL